MVSNLCETASIIGDENEQSRKIQRITSEFSLLKQRIEILEQQVDDSHYVLPKRFQSNVRNSSVKICSLNDEPCGVGFFVSENVIVTAAHNLNSYKQVHSDTGEKIVKAFIYESSDVMIAVNLVLTTWHADYDLAVLKYDSNHSEFLRINSDCDISLGENRLAITTFSITMDSILKEDVNIRNISLDTFAVMSAELFMIKKNHFVYRSNCFSGDSGGAIIFSNSGKVVGLHLETVNEANEELELGKFKLADVAESVNSCVRGFSSGFLGLRLDTETIQKIIFG